MENKFESYLISLQLVKINEVDFTKFVYAEELNSSNFLGGKIRESYKQGNYLNILKDKLFKKCVFNVRFVPTKNGSKYSLLKIDNISL